MSQHLRGNVQGCVSELLWRPRAAQLAIASAAGEFILVDFAAGVDWPLLQASETGGQGFDALGFSSCGRWMAAGGEAGSLLQVLELDGQTLTSVAWRFDGQALAAGGEEGGWVLWPLDPGDEARP